MWKTVSLWSRLIFLLGVFFVFSAVGFSSDVQATGRTPPLRFILGALISGVFPVFYVVGGFAFRKVLRIVFLPLFAVQFYLMTTLSGSLPAPQQVVRMSPSEISRIQRRLALDGNAIILVVGLGYACFAYVTITEGQRFFRVKAEIDLATEIHQVLVPEIDTNVGGYQFYGRSSPSGEVGGDLIDVAGTDENWVAYLADVSGHGVAPGVVVGMVKSGVRMLLQSGESICQLLPRLNEVLFPLKKPDMFITFCFLAPKEDGLRIGLAGHPAILHFSSKTNEVSQLECPNMPLGIIPTGDFEISEIRPEQGDVFALYTDGFLESANAAGEEFGLARFQEEFKKHAREPLEAIYKSLQESVSRHGVQLDDQSLLLIRKA